MLHLQQLGCSLVDLRTFTCLVQLGTCVVVMSMRACVADTDLAFEVEGVLTSSLSETSCSNAASSIAALLTDLNLMLNLCQSLLKCRRCSV